MAILVSSLLAGKSETKTERLCVAYYVITVLASGAEQTESEIRPESGECIES